MHDEWRLQHRYRNKHRTAARARAPPLGPSLSPTLPYPLGSTRAAPSAPGPGVFILPVGAGTTGTGGAGTGTGVLCAPSTKEKGGAGERAGIQNRTSLLPPACVSSIRLYSSLSKVCHTYVPRSWSLPCTPVDDLVANSRRPSRLSGIRVSQATAAPAPAPASSVRS